MTAVTIQEKLKRQPFEPFEIVLSSGDRYPITHPDWVLLTRRSVVVAVSSPKARGPLPESYADLSYLHIASLQPILASTKTSRRSA
jgi:hypothetical protein